MAFFKNTCPHCWDNPCTCKKGTTCNIKNCICDLPKTKDTQPTFTLDENPRVQ